MATIINRKKRDGTPSYSAQIVIKRNGATVHRESRTFIKHALAKSWANKRELELQQQDVFEKKQKLTIGSIITDYLDNFSTGRSKGMDMRRLLKYDIAKIDANTLSSSDIIRHCRLRNTEAKPQTVKNDVIWLKVALSTIKGLRDYSYSLDAITSASMVLNREGLICSSDKRTRVPTQHELWQLSRHFSRLPKYLYIMWFAIYSARRLSEICKLKWSDINHENRTIFVRDMKTPNKKNLSLWAKLPLSAYKIAIKQAKTSEFIFPYNEKTVSAYFTRSCKILAIDDLHFHDLRRLAITHLFDSGLSINDVVQVSLHQSWSSLKIYVKDKPGDVDI